MQEGPSAVNTMQEGPSAVNMMQEGPSAVNTMPEGPSAVDTMPEGPSAVDTMPEGPSAVDTMPEGPSAVNTMPEGPSAVDTMPDQGTQRCLDDAGKTCRRPSLSRRRESNRCHDDGKREQPPGRWRDSRLRRGVSRKLGRVDALTYSDRPQSSLSILLLVLTSRATPNVMLLESCRRRQM